MVLTAVEEPIQAEAMFTPGAKASRQRPQDENWAMRSLRSVAPTVKAPWAAEGEPLQASALASLPAATKRGMLALAMRLAAASTACDLPPPIKRDRERVRESEDRVEFCGRKRCE